MGLCLMLLVFTTGISKARAEGDQASTSSVQSEVHLLTINNQKSFRYRLDNFTNRHGEHELQVSLNEAHWLAKDTSLVVLRGRDTDSDGLIDAWFYSEGQIVKAVKKQAKSADAWLTARELLLDFSLNEERWISTLITSELLSGLFFTADGEIQDSKELEQMQIDLLDLDYKIAALDQSQENQYPSKELKRVSNEGWMRLIDRLTRARTEDRNKRALGDAAQFVGSGVALKGVEFLLVKGLTSEALTSVSISLRNSMKQQDGWIPRMSSRISNWTPKKTILADSAASSETKGIFQSFRFTSVAEALSWLSRKTFFSSSLQKIGGLIKDAARGSWDQKTYIATAQTIQLAVESYSRGYWRFSDVPLVLNHPVESTHEFINQISHDNGLMQNMAYMTLQTTLLSGVTDALHHRGTSLGVKYAVCSMITLTDSMGINVLVKGETDAKRIGFDTGWELLVGGTQVQADLAMLRWAKDLAEKYKNPKLKVVGYLLGSIDQLLGYSLYNKATSTYFEPSHEIPPVVIVPVMAPR
jgi:hypothetical protein